MPTHQRAMGALPNPPDNRDIRLSKVQSPVALPKKYITDIDELKQRDQKRNGSCVGQAGSYLVDFFERLESGDEAHASARGLYALCKARDGYNGEGTYPRILAQVLTKIGCPTTATVPDDNDLPHSEYINVPETRQLLEDAYPFRVDTNYAWVDPDVESIKQAIYQNKVLLASIMVGEDNDDTGKIEPKPPRGRHYILLYGFRDYSSGKTRIYFKNSWGKKWGDFGTGYIEFPAHAGFIYDIAAFVDIPNEILEEARETNYIFTRTMKRGARGVDVRELQKRLSREIAFDGFPCFRWPNANEQQFTTYYGVETEAAVQRYQKTQGIVSYGSPETTGYGQLGPTTREYLNAEEADDDPGLYPAVQEKADTLIAIADAIGHPIKITDAYRSPEEQDELYAQGRTKPGQIVTNARGGESYHNWRCAFDVVFVTQGGGVTYEGPWDMLGAIGRAIGCEWGGDWDQFVDRPHFQYTAGYTLEDFQLGNIDEKRLGVDGTMEGNLEGGDYQIKSEPMLKRFKSLLISAASVLVTAVAAVVLTPEWATFVQDVYAWLGEAGVPASIVVVGGLVVAEIWKAMLNRRKISEFSRDHGVAAAQYQEHLDLY